ncbi:hypothetical protein E2562_022450 [Oryza meyeriana var. granulata]|uniref:Uncharacterized protein n=1 Tax=Oryza meyeriana var. granulata TaxID=110450 RepID=A0A6G1BMD0_9ORYZ|nr:hypothetical protein E2562_022450 [Oryza meyeriana var. granulata]
MWAVGKHRSRGETVAPPCMAKCFAYTPGAGPHLHRRVESYLDTQGDYVGKSGQRLGRVQILQCRIDHCVQCINVTKLGSHPPHE